MKVTGSIYAFVEIFMAVAGKGTDAWAGKTIGISWHDVNQEK
jgi:hypothetical protein